MFTKNNLIDIFSEDGYDEDTSNGYITFKFGLRMTIINLIVLKPLFGTGLLEYYFADKK
jgi:hypothetical protein